MPKYSLLYVHYSLPNKLKNVLFIHVPTLTAGYAKDDAIAAAFSSNIVRAVLLAAGYTNP